MPFSDKPSGTAAIGIDPHRPNFHGDFVLEAVLVESLRDDQALRAVVRSLESVRDVKEVQRLKLAFSVVWFEVRILNGVSGMPISRLWIDNRIGHFREG